VHCNRELEFSYQKEPVKNHFTQFSTCKAVGHVGEIRYKFMEGHITVDCVRITFREDREDPEDTGN